MWGEGLSDRDAAAEYGYTSITPDAKYAWGSNLYRYKFYVDVQHNQVKDTKFSMPFIAGVNGRFGDENKHAMVMEVRDYQTHQAWSWRPLGHNRTLEFKSLYNAFANNGLWFKEAK